MGGEAADAQDGCTRSSKYARFGVAVRAMHLCTIRSMVSLRVEAVSGSHSGRQLVVDPGKSV